MSSISVAELRCAVLPEPAALVGGEAGLAREVSGTATLRARTPAFPALRGGEIALVSLLLLQQVDPGTRTDRLVAQLADAGISAVVFLDVTTHNRPLVEPAAHAGDDLSLPVFVVPPGHAAGEIELAVHRTLAERREATLRRSQALHAEFTHLALAGAGIGAIVDRLATLSGLPAAWEDTRFEVRHWAMPATAAPLLPDQAVDLPAVLRGARLPLQRWAHGRATGSASGASPPTGAPDESSVAVLPLRAEGAGGEASTSAWRRLAVAVMAPGRVAGYLSLVTRHDTPLHEARLALAAAGLAASIDALRVHTVSEAMSDALSSFTRNWLNGRYDSPSELASHAARLGHTPRPPYLVLVLDAAATLPPDVVRAVIDAVHQAAGVAVGGDSAAAAPRVGRADEPAPSHQAGADALWAATAEGRTAALVPIADPAAAETAAAAVHTTLAASVTAPHGGVFCGIGRAAARVEDVPQAHREALGALAVARRLGGHHRVAYFGTLGVYRLLAAVSPVEELAAFHDDVLGPLSAHDARSGSQLVQTLDAYLSSGGSVQVTAERLHTHRNTILYRLDRIQEVLGVDPRRPDQQLTLHLALRAAEVLGDRPAPPSPGQVAQPAGAKIRTKRT